MDSETFDHKHQSVLSLVIPEDQPAFLEANSRAMEQGEPWDLHYRIQRADGTIRTIRSLGEAVFEHGVAAHLRGVTQDVTESRQAEEDLQQSVERFDLVTRATRDGVFDWNIEAGTCWFSANSRAIFGYDQIGHEGSIEEWRVRIHPSDRSMVSQAMESQFASDEPYNVEYRFLRADGVWRWFQSFGILQRDDDGKPVRMVGSNRDVSERRQADERFRVLFERSTDPHLLVDQRGIIDCNRATLEMLGCPDQESLVGQHPAELSPEQQPDGRVSSEKAKEMDALARARGFHRYEWTHQRFDGEEFLVETTMSPVALDSGPALLVVWHDISVRKRAEEALRDAKDAAEHSNKAKSDFLASMSHEIRTPLNGVIGMLGLMMRGKLDNTQRDQAEVARQSAESLLSLINDILDVSKLEAGRVDVERIDFDLLDVVSGVAELLGPRAKEGGNVIDVTYAPDVPVDIGSDPTKIRQVLFNLVGNAIKFTHEGSVSVNVMCIDRSDAGATMRFEVTDTGIGIDPAVRDTLFEKFAQADASISRRYGGTGLGLSICRMLLEALGGRIGVDSELGVGSTFWFELPVSVSSVIDVAIRDAGDEPDHAVDAGSLANYKILLAEDNLINQQIAVTLLVDAGADVDTALNGIEVVEMAPLEPYDVVLMDIRMPELDGLEATKRIRALGGSCAEIPIIAMTANAMRGDRDAYIAAGMNDYVSKPLAFGKLFRTLLKWAPSAGHVEAGAASLAAESAADDVDDAGGDAAMALNTVVEVLANAGNNKPADAPDIDETVIAGLETALGPQKVKDLVGLQIKTARELLTILRTGVESSDDEQVIGAAHDLKSTFGQFGALDASAAAAVIEEGFRSGDFDRSGDGIAKCLSLSERAVGALAARYSLSDAA
ncbi:MAG: PAS domain-containing protein [Alphaproteobacteria bacterium]|nr:PAS domain-containing protein [Alphaproteobacteria bacterium]